MQCTVFITSSIYHSPVSIRLFLLILILRDYRRDYRSAKEALPMRTDLLKQYHNLLVYRTQINRKLTNRPGFSASSSATSTAEEAPQPITVLGTVGQVGQHTRSLGQTDDDHE